MIIRSFTERVLYITDALFRIFEGDTNEDTLAIGAVNLVYREGYR